MMTTEKPLYEVVNMRMAGHLMSVGFVLMDVVHKEQSNSFLFVDTPQLHEAMRRQSERLKNKANTNTNRRNYDGEYKDLYKSNPR